MSQTVEIPLQEIKFDALMNVLCETNFEYGFHTRRGKVYLQKDHDDKTFDKLFRRKYHRMSLGEIVYHRCGVCWDMVELERDLLQDRFQGDPELKIHSFFLSYDNMKKYSTHSCIVVEYDSKAYWIEYSWEKYRGIRKYDSLSTAMHQILMRFSCVIKSDLTSNVFMYEYDKLPEGLSERKVYKYIKKHGTLIKRMDKAKLELVCESVKITKS